MKARHGGDRGQSFAAKSQCGHAKQVFGVLDFRRRVALEGEHGIVANHAASVVGDLNQLLAAGLDVDLDARCARIQRVLQQFLYYGSRALHHLAGGDLVGYLLGEYVNAAHEAVLSSQWVEISFADGGAEGKDAECTKGGKGLT